MRSHGTSRRRTTAALGAVAGLVLAAAGTGAPATAATPQPPITIEAASKAVTGESWDGYTYLDLGVYAVAGRRPFEIRARRTSYGKRLSAVQVRPGRDRRLPTGVAAEDFSGLADFFTVVVRTKSGRTVVNQTQSFCPNSYQQVRRRPTAPASSRYPLACQGTPYGRSAVYGLQAGYATPALGESEMQLDPGSYVASISVRPYYRRLFGIPAKASSATVEVTVVKGEDEEGELRSSHRTTPPSARLAAPSKAAMKRLPQVSAARARRYPLSDLRSLPAWGIGVADGRYLEFSATVWNAGPSPLVVDGFLSKRDPDLMNAYQYFFDRRGKQVGYSPVGTMEWDDRDGHTHWHFTDFASYRLLDSHKKLVVKSQKEAFCLANTDAVDYLVKGANWRPENTDLHTSCGTRSSVGVREVLETGSGDTYVQYLPGQSFDLRGVKNGTYYIQVAANPAHALHESNVRNNSSYRKVTVSGRPGARTVTPAKVGIISEPVFDDEDEERAR